MTYLGNYYSASTTIAVNNCYSVKTHNTKISSPCANITYKEYYHKVVQYLNKTGHRATLIALGSSKEVRVMCDNIHILVDVFNEKSSLDKPCQFVTSFEDKANRILLFTQACRRTGARSANM